MTTPRLEPNPGRPLVLPGSRGVFVSFRRGDADEVAARLAARLAHRFVVGPIILGPAADRAGSHGIQAVGRVIGRCDVLLAVIGRHWVDNDDNPGTNLLRAPDDPVRIEVAAALSRGIPVIPVLVDGATMPTAEQLPDALAALADRTAVTVRQLTLREDSLRLTAVIERVLPRRVLPALPTAELDEAQKPPRSTRMTRPQPAERTTSAAAATTAGPASSGTPVTDRTPQEGPATGRGEAPGVVSPRRPSRALRRRVLIAVGGLLLLAVIAVISYRVARGPVPAVGEQPPQSSGAPTTPADRTTQPSAATSSVGISTRPSTIGSTIGSTSAAPLIDGPTAVWFGTICAGQRDLQRFATPVTGGSLSAAQTGVVTAYTNLSGSAARTTVALKALPAPAVPDGANYRRFRIAQFTAIADGYRTAAATISAFTPASAEALTAKINSVEAAVKIAVTNSMAGSEPLPAQYQIAVQQLPACAGVSG